MPVLSINKVLTPAQWAILFKELRIATASEKRNMIAELNDVAEFVSIARSSHAVRQRFELRRKLIGLENHAQTAARDRGSIGPRYRDVIRKHRQLRDLLRFQAAMAIDPKHEQAALLDGRADGRLAQAMDQNPQELAHFAARARHAVDQPADDPAHLRAVALDRVIALLGDRYWFVTGQVPGASFGTDMPGGPFIRLLEHVLPALGWPRRTWHSRRALRERLHRLKRNGTWDRLSRSQSGR